MRKIILNLTLLTLVVPFVEVFSFDETSIYVGNPIELYSGESDCQIHEVQCLDSVTASVNFSGYCSNEELIKAALGTCGPEIISIEALGLIDLLTTDDEGLRTHFRTKSRSNGSGN